MTIRILAVFAMLLTLVACGGEPESQTAGNIDLALAAEYFEEFDALCAGPDRLQGPGWRLDLEDGWAIVAAERPGDFVVREE